MPHQYKYHISYPLKNLMTKYLMPPAEVPKSDQRTPPRGRFKKRIDIKDAVAASSSKLELISYLNHRQLQVTPQ